MAHRLQHQREVAIDTSGHQQDRAGGAGHDLPGRLDPVKDRHQQVHKDHVGPVLPRPPHRLGAVLGHPGDAVARLGQHDAAERLAGEQQVVDDGDSHVQASPMRSATARRKVLS